MLHNSILLELSYGTSGYGDLAAWNVRIKISNIAFDFDEECVFAQFVFSFCDLIDPFPPGWITVEILPLGNMTWLYSNLADQRIRKAIAKTFHLQTPVLDSWMTVITLTRNSCCHHARMWNKINPIIPNDMKNDFKNKLTGIFNLLPEIDLRAMGFNANWEQEPLWR